MYFQTQNTRAIIISNTTFYPSLTIAPKEPRFIAKETLF